MTAKNTLGQSIASAICGPITRSGEFAQSLSVKTTEPIASLEWFPSKPNSMLGVEYFVTDLTALFFRVSKSE
jgi:hypothetical protein